MTIFLLGPGRDEKGTSGPLEARRLLAKWMDRFGAQTLVMEDREQREEENHLAMFQRLVREEQVTIFAIVVPLQSRLHGLSVEIGHLLTRIQDGMLDPSRVHLLLQSLLLSIDDEGTLALEEKGNRTRYYGDLVDEGCPIHRWTDWSELQRHTAAVAAEDAEATAFCHRD